MQTDDFATQTDGFAMPTDDFATQTDGFAIQQDDFYMGGVIRLF